MRDIFKSLSPEEFKRLPKINPERIKLTIEIGELEMLAVDQHTRRGGNAGKAAWYMKAAKNLN